MSGRCVYVLAWIGQCKKPADGDFCDKHLGKPCASCGEQAVGECSYTGQFVCGAPLCPKCIGGEDQSKPSGAWGFMNHNHRRKAEFACEPATPTQEP